MADIGKEAADIAALEEIMNGGNARVSVFSYDQESYDKETAESINGVAAYDYAQGNNIPIGTSEYLDTSETTLNKGLRSQSSSLPRQLMNHLFGRMSFNLNKIHEWFLRFLGSYREDLRKNCNLWSPTTTYKKDDVCFTLTTTIPEGGEQPTLQLWIWIARGEVPAGNEPKPGSTYWEPSNNYDDMTVGDLHVKGNVIVDDTVTAAHMDTGDLHVAGKIEADENITVTGSVAAKSVAATDKVSAESGEFGTMTADSVDGDFEINNMHLADDAVGTRNIQDQSVTGEKLADDSVTGDKLADNTVTGDKLTMPFLLPVQYKQPGGMTDDTTNISPCLAFTPFGVKDNCIYAVLNETNASGGKISLVKVPFGAKMGDSSVETIVSADYNSSELNVQGYGNIGKFTLLVTKDIGDNEDIYLPLLLHDNNAALLYRRKGVVHIEPVGGTYKSSNFIFSNVFRAYTITSVVQVFGIYSDGVHLGFFIYPRVKDPVNSFIGKTAASDSEGNAYFIVFDTMLYYIVKKTPDNYNYLKPIQPSVTENLTLAASDNRGRDTFLYATDDKIYVAFLNGAYMNSETNGYSGSTALGVIAVPNTNWLTTSVIDFNTEGTIPSNIADYCSPIECWLCDNDTGGTLLLPGAAIHAAVNLMVGSMTGSKCVPHLISKDGSVAGRTEGSGNMAVTWCKGKLTALPFSLSLVQFYKFAMTKHDGTNYYTYLSSQSGNLSTLKTEYQVYPEPKIEYKTAGAGVVSVTEESDGSRTLTFGTDDTLKFNANGTIDTGSTVDFYSSYVYFSHAVNWLCPMGTGVDGEPDAIEEGIITILHSSSSVGIKFICKVESNLGKLPNIDRALYGINANDLWNEIIESIGAKYAVLDKSKPIGIACIASVSVYVDAQAIGGAAGCVIHSNLVTTPGYIFGSTITSGAMPLEHWYPGFKVEVDDNSPDYVRVSGTLEITLMQEK